MTQIASFGFDWHAAEISKIGNVVSLKMDGVLLGSVDMTNYVGTTAGTNISFGHADINAGLSADPYYDDVSFTLIDNIVVSVATAIDADFDGDGDADGDDFLTWQEFLGLGTGATNAQGDADGDGDVDGADLDAWEAAFPQNPAVAAGGAVPEPAAGCLAALAVLLLMAGRNRRIET
jgi:hypothetical protein